MADRSRASPAPYPDATRQAALLRALWKRGGRGGRRVLTRCAKLWLSWRAPVVVPIAAGSIVLNGPGFCARAVLLTGGYELADEVHFQALLHPGVTYPRLKPGGLYLTDSGFRLTGTPVDYDWLGDTGGKPGPCYHESSLTATE